jgi:hypothetical protein
MLTVVVLVLGAGAVQTWIAHAAATSFKVVGGP